MKRYSEPNLYVALVHSPVKDKNGEIITSAVTNLDLHDIARTARTYGVRAFFVVTPLVEQQTFVTRIVDHWVTGYGAGYNPDRKEALALIRVVATLDGAVEAITDAHGIAPKRVVTTARTERSNLGYRELSRAVLGETPYLLTFGTAWGLTEAFMESADFVLEPVTGIGDYNHLPVRAAAAIILDRITARD